MVSVGDFSLELSFGTLESVDYAIPVLGLLTVGGSCVINLENSLCQLHSFYFR
jgi:hypothetical protein